MGLGGVQSNKPLHNEAGKTRMVVMREGDYRQLLAVARAADKFVYNSSMIKDYGQLEHAVDALNKPRSKAPRASRKAK
jgi:hypothetical protein